MIQMLANLIWLHSVQYLHADIWASKCVNIGGLYMAYNEQSATLDYERAAVLNLAAEANFWEKMKESGNHKCGS